jgi:hypothetical protein
VRPQIEAKKTAATKGHSRNAFASLILMNDNAEVVFERWPFDEDMVQKLEILKHARARSHGN